MSDRILLESGTEVLLLEDSSSLLLEEPLGSTASVLVPEVYGGPVYHSALIATEVYGEVPLEDDTQLVALGLIDGASATYAPTVANADSVQLLTLDLIDGGASTYTPTAYNFVPVLLDLLDTGAAVYDASLTQVAVAIAPPLVDSGAVTYSPTVVAAPIEFVLGLLDTGPTAYDPTVAQGPAILTLVLVNAVAAVYAPTVLPQPVTVDLGLNATALAIYAPVIIPIVNMVLPALDTAADTYAPSLQKTTTDVVIDEGGSNPDSGGARYRDSRYRGTALVKVISRPGFAGFSISPSWGGINVGPGGTVTVPPIGSGGGGGGGGGGGSTDPEPPVGEPPGTGFPDDGTRPFAAPVTTQTLTLPGSVNRMGSADAAATINSFLASCPNGSIIDFGTGTLRLDTGLLMQGKNNLVLQGNNITLRMNGSDSEPFSTFLLRASNNIKIQNFIVHGSYAGVTALQGELSHCLGLSGFFNPGPSSYVEMSGVTGDHFFGDFAYLEGSNGGAFPPSHHVWIHDNNFTECGRNGVSFINCTDVLVERNTMNRMNYHALDWEPNFDPEETRRIVVRHNAFGSYAHRSGLIGYFAQFYSPNNPGGSDIEITDNTVAGIASDGVFGQPRGLDSKFLGTASSRLADILFRGNSTSRSVPRSGIAYFEKVDGVVCTGNNQPGNTGFTQTSDCTAVTSGPNP